MDVFARPPRLVIFNLNENEGYEVQFNPTQFQESLSVNYDRMDVMGFSHKPLQYNSTSNMVIQMDLFFLSQDAPTHVSGQKVRRFLYSLCYAPKNTQAIVSGQPPRVLVVWPNTMSLTAKLTKLDITNTRFNILGQITEFTAAVEFEEVMDVRWTSEDALAQGIQKGGLE
jgi:hypothetical protein